MNASGEIVGRVLANVADCPGTGMGFSVATGRFGLWVRAAGAWTARVEQQVDVPLVEPPTEEMKDGNVVARATFYDIERHAEGRVLVYQLRDGSSALRLENLFVTPNVDLEIDASPLARPTSTREFRSAPFERLTMLPVTTGAMNFPLEGRLDLRRWRSLVIYCEPLDITYAAATLKLP